MTKRAKKPPVHEEWDHAVESFADYLCQAVKPVYYNEMQPFSVFSSRFKSGFHSTLDEFHTRFFHGWDLLVHGLNGGIKFNYTIPDHHHVENKLGKIKKKRLGAQTLATKLGLSDELILAFYETAKGLLEQKNDASAADAFFCLSMLCPQVSTLWLGLARAEHGSRHLQTALGAYQMALILDKTHPELYVEAARCCVDMHDYDTGLAILGEAESFADAHPHAKNGAMLRECAVRGKQEIKRMQTSAR